MSSSSLPDGPDADSTTPIDGEQPRPAAVDREEVRRVLERLATEPLRLRSDNLVLRPWGGRRLIELKGLEGAARPGRVGESFEVSACPSDPEAARYPSVVEFEDGSAMRLTELLARAGEAVLGSAFFAAYGPQLPLLPKFLDVEALLSVQSHPPGNPELYVVVDCEPGASLRIGFAREVDPAATMAALAAGRADQEALLELVWVPQERLAEVCGDLFGTPGAVERLSERFAPLLRDPASLPRLRELLTRLDACYRETLALLERVEVRPGMVLFNAHPPGPSHPLGGPTPSAEVHCLGNPERKSMLLLEIRRPGVTYRAWDHVRFPLRELSITAAFEAMNCAASRAEDFIIEPRAIAGRPGVFRSVECPAFVVDHLRPRPGLAVAVATEGLPSTLHAIAGSVRLYGPDDRDWGTLSAGRSLLLPAQVASLRVEALTTDAELVQVTIPLPLESVAEVSGGEAKRQNLAQMRRIVAESQGPSEVLAIVNPGDADSIARRLTERASAIFRADGATAVTCHEERTRRGQLLGMLDASRAHRAEHGELDQDRVALGIMLPGKGTRLSPLTQRLGGLKPLFPVPIQAEQDGQRVWLDAASASLWTWTLVAWTLERQGFRGIAWKWGDEPQIAARELAGFDYDLSDVDAVRFGAAATITEDLARNKEWLLVDPESGDLVMQVRRRERAQLLERMGLPDRGEVGAHVHIGSPAFSHLFMREAEAVFGDCEGWLDVDGYLFEALTQDLELWADEVERDGELRALLGRCPDFYERARELRRRIEEQRGHPMRIAVVDFGSNPYWADIGQLGKARAVWSTLGLPGEEAAFARALAGIDQPPDEFGNTLVGEVRIPKDGSVRDSVIIDSVIERGRVEGAVVVRSELGLAGLEAGAVVIDCRVAALRVGREGLAFGSTGEYLRVPEHFVHTSIAAGAVMESWFADARDNQGAPENYEQVRHGNPMSFAAKLAQLRGRE
ncbi:MAG: hypothetical protein R6X02_07405 [Enhygromyxa sp.]